MNVESLQLGHIAQMIQLKDYNYHQRALNKAMTKPSEYRDYSRPKNFEKVIKKSKEISNVFNKEESRVNIDNKNKTLLRNISLIKNGHYKTFITQKEHAVSHHQLKSLRNESIARENKRITSENAKFMGRLQEVSSTIQAASLLKSSDATQKHLTHLSKYNPSKRSMKFSSPWLESNSNANASIATQKSQKSFKGKLKSMGPHGFLPGFWDANNSSTMSKQKPAEGTHPYNHKDSNVERNIEDNFYPAGTLLIEMTHDSGEIKDMLVSITVTKTDGTDLQKNTHIFEEKSHCPMNIQPQMLKGVDAVEVEITISAPGGEAKPMSSDTFGTGKIPVMLLKDESAEEGEGKHSYVEKFNESVKADEEEGAKFGLKIILV